MRQVIHARYLRQHLSEFFLLFHSGLWNFQTVIYELVHCLLIVVARNIKEADEDFEDGGLLERSTGIFRDGILCKFEVKIALVVLVSTFSKQVLNLECIFVCNGHIQRFDPLLVGLLHKAVLIVDLTKLLETNTHAILDEALHVTVDLQVLLLNQLLVLILQSTLINLG